MGYEKKCFVRRFIMVFRNLALGTTALVLSFQMMIAAATISVLMFHPEIMSDFEKASETGTPLMVTCSVSGDTEDVDWDVSDRALV